ncbi:hypothetical protein, partial [Xanthomonas axonopodis]|uniref:hypothetical protein n=1 Tax=Xanthomonas axonopodis TaxID=53413 RepID=UPI001C25905F
RHLSTAPASGPHDLHIGKYVLLALFLPINGFVPRLGRFIRHVAGRPSLATCRKITSHQVLGVFAGSAEELVELHLQVPNVLGPRYLASHLPQR